MQNDVCAVLTLEGWKISLCLLKMRFLVVGLMSMICDIATSLEANPGPIFSLHEYAVETSKPPVHIRLEWTLQ